MNAFECPRITGQAVQLLHHVAIEPAFAIQREEASVDDRIDDRSEVVSGAMLLLLGGKCFQKRDPRLEQPAVNEEKLKLVERRFAILRVLVREGHRCERQLGFGECVRLHGISTNPFVARQRRSDSSDDSEVRQTEVRLAAVACAISSKVRPSRYRCSRSDRAPEDNRLTQSASALRSSDIADASTGSSASESGISSLSSVRRFLCRNSLRHRFLTTRITQARGFVIA